MKYFKATVKFGHVGKSNFYKGYVYLKAESKKEAAENYCKTVSQFTTANGGKPWKYAIVADNDFERTHQLQYVLSKNRVQISELLDVRQGDAHFSPTIQIFECEKSRGHRYGLGY